MCPMALRIELYSLIPDGRLADLSRAWPSAKAHLADIVLVDAEALPAAAQEALVGAISHPLRHRVRLPGADLPDGLPAFDWAIEVGFLPGVTDNVATTLHALLRDRLDQAPAVSSALMYLVSGPKDAAQAMAAALHNPLIQRASLLDRQSFLAQGGFPARLPRVHLTSPAVPARPIPLDLGDTALADLGRLGIEEPQPDGTLKRRGPLGLSLADLRAIKAHFDDLGRAPTDVELECLAQTWSEHCKHRIFNAALPDAPEGLFKRYIRRATETVRARRGDQDFCISVFTDNAGGIVFDDQWMICDKVETHNSPSALDPFGGAITGILGVNRDVVGFGLGALPVANRYGFCFADPDDQRRLFRQADGTQEMLSARRIADGVIQGVEAGGNESGIPTVLGFVHTDPGYRGKPLVFCGTVGLLPRQIAGRPATEKAARPGDLVVMVGGRVGKDGIHGATFSSVALDSGSPVTAVQIGDAITQKRWSDALIKEARDEGLYSSITDNGAGGLSSSVGEMAEQSGGVRVSLEQVPLKYPGLAPWEIWISESQERMTLAVPPASWPRLQALLAARDVEVTVIGEFTDSGRVVVTWHGEAVADLDIGFLHEGAPDKGLRESPPPAVPARPATRPLSPADALPALLAHPAVGSRESLCVRFDHTVQGTAVLGPLQGPGRIAGDAAALKPVADSPRAVILSQGVQPHLAPYDCQAMAEACVDYAVRAAIAAGAPADHIAILDNVCWASADEPERVAQLHAMARGCHDAAVALGTPFISGKDSMFNDFKGFDADGQALKLSIKPTLLISAIAVAPDWQRVVSLDAKTPGDTVLLVGPPTGPHLGGSLWEQVVDAQGGAVGRFDPTWAETYAILSTLIQAGRINAALPVGMGGVATAAAKMALGGQRGLALTLGGQAADPNMSPEGMLFAETLGRVLLTVAAEHRDSVLAQIPSGCVQGQGTVQESPDLSLHLPGGTALHWPLETLRAGYAAADVWAGP